jgi:hypothetical protein
MMTATKSTKVPLATLRLFRGFLVVILDHSGYDRIAEFIALLPKSTNEQ